MLQTHCSTPGLLRESAYKIQEVYLTMTCAQQSSLDFLRGENVKGFGRQSRGRKTRNCITHVHSRPCVAEPQAELPIKEQPQATFRLLHLYRQTRHLHDAETQ